MDVMFARTRHNYDSYMDFWTLVEVSGFRSCFVDEIDLASNTIYVFTPHSGEFTQLIGSRGGVGGWSQRRCKLVWWMLERPDSGPVLFEDAITSVQGVIDAGWVSDRSVAADHPRMIHAILGGHPGLSVCFPEADKAYDFAHMSYAWGRRDDLYARMRGIGLREAPIGFGAERSQILARSKIVLNAQQYPAPVIAPLRFAMAAAHSLPVLTETVADPYPHERGVDLLDGPIDRLPEMAANLLRNPDMMARLARALRDRLCVTWTFANGVKDALHRTFGRT